MSGDRAANIARRLIDEFGSLGATLAAGGQAIGAAVGDAAAVNFLAVVHAAHRHSLSRKLMDGPILSNAGTLSDYLHVVMSHEPSEHLRVLFLNSQNRLLRDQIMGWGSIKEAPVYPREIIKRALDVGATALILVHNHPSGDHRPSRDDIEVTSKISRAAEALDITIHDHLIVSQSGQSSLRTLGHL